MNRKLSTLIAAPLWAMDARTGTTRLLAMLEDEHRMGATVVAMDVEGASRDASYINEFYKKTGLFPYYENEDGSTVHSLDADAGQRLKDGAIAIVPMNGVMVKEAWMIEEVAYGLISAQRIEATINALAKDARVKAICIEAYSPGGMVWGTEGVGISIANASKVKTVYTVVDGLAASAMYWAASQGSKILLKGQTSEVGSIGVMCSFWDMVPFFESIGLKRHELYAPESSLKNEEYRALVAKESDPSVWKKSLSETAQLFIATVKTGRGDRVSASDASVFQGRVFQGQAALDAGLADGYATLSEAVHQLRASAATTKTTTGVPNASLKTETNNDMSFKSLMTGMIASIVGAFENKENINADNLAALNAELKVKGVEGVVVVNAERLAAMETSEQAVATAQAAQLAAEQLAATNATTSAAKETELNNTIATLQAEVETLKNSKADDGQAEGVVNKTGERQTGSDTPEQAVANLPHNVAARETLAKRGAVKTEAAKA